MQETNPSAFANTETVPTGEHFVRSWTDQKGCDVDEGATFLRVGDAWLDLDRMPARGRPPPGEQHSVWNADAGA